MFKVKKKTTSGDSIQRKKIVKRTKMRKTLLIKREAALDKSLKELENIYADLLKKNCHCDTK